jgi:hypothetical protein
MLGGRCHKQENEIVASARVIGARWAWTASNGTTTYSRQKFENNAGQAVLLYCHLSLMMNAEVQEYVRSSVMGMSAGTHRRTCSHMSS